MPVPSPTRVPGSMSAAAVVAASRFSSSRLMCRNAAASAMTSDDGASTPLGRDRGVAAQQGRERVACPRR